MVKRSIVLGMALLLTCMVAGAQEDIMDVVEHKFADSNGVKIHYAAAGEGPLIVFIHGFPDFWYSWKDQMLGLKDEYRVCAMDTRGYNKSDQPEGAENYDMPLLIGDVASVIKAEGEEKAIIVGHDWGGGIAWTFAMQMPQMTEKLIIVNLPHMANVARELKTNEEQIANSAYARQFQQEGSHKMLNAQMLAGFVGKDEDTKAKYVEAFENSSFAAMMAYYQRNYPREPFELGDLPKVKAPVLQFHGLQDTALHRKGLNDTWDHLEQDYTLVTIPDAGHWAHHEAADLVTDTMKWWLAMRK